MQTSILLLVVISLILHLTSSEWIDPHSMDTNHKKVVKSHFQDSVNQNPQQCATVIKKECDSDLHLRRIVRIILNNAFFDNEAGYHEGYINIKLSSADHQLLVKFSQGVKVEDSVFGEVSHILENAFQKPASERYQEAIMSLQEQLHSLIVNPASTALFGMSVALLITYKLLKAQFTWKSIMIFFSLLAYLADAVVTYLNIMREEEVQSMVTIKTLGTAPPECDPKKMSWWDFIKLQSNFAENPCKEYYRATYQNYFYMIAPSKILTRQFRTLIVEPCGDMGEAFGKFGRSMFTSLPWGLNVVLFPIMLATACGLVFTLFLFIFKPNFKISLFHLFSIELGNTTRHETIHVLNHDANRKAVTYVPNRHKKKRLGTSSKEVGLTTNHRALVEEVSHDTCSSHGRGQKEVKKKSPSKETCNKNTDKTSKKEEGGSDTGMSLTHTNSGLSAD